MTQQEEAARIEKRLANLKKLLKTLPLIEWSAFAKYYDAGIDEATVAAGMLKRGTVTDADDLVLGPVEHRYLLLHWQEYGNQFDEINPDEWEEHTDSLQQARELVEQQICRDISADYLLRCRVFDLDDGVELRWHEVREIQWGDSPEA